MGAPSPQPIYQPIMDNAQQLIAGTQPSAPAPEAAVPETASPEAVAQINQSKQLLEVAKRTAQLQALGQRKPNSGASRSKTILTGDGLGEASGEKKSLLGV